MAEQRLHELCALIIRDDLEVEDFEKRIAVLEAVDGKP